jgi:hypothetical protein
MGSDCCGTQAPLVSWHSQSNKKERKQNLSNYMLRSFIASLGQDKSKNIFLSSLGFFSRLIRHHLIHIQISSQSDIALSVCQHVSYTALLTQPLKIYWPVLSSFHCLLESIYARIMVLLFC